MSGLELSGWGLYYALRGTNLLLKDVYRRIDQGIESRCLADGEVEELEEQSIAIWEHLMHIKDVYAKACQADADLPAFEQALAPDGGEAGVNPHRGTDPRITGA